MSKIVKYTEFKKVVDELCKKIKDNYVHLYKKNIINGETIINDGYVKGNTMITLNPTYEPDLGGDGSVSQSDSCFSHKSLEIPANTKVGKVTLIVDSTLNEGDTVIDVNVGAISKDRDEVLDYVIEDSTAKVHLNNNADLTGTKAITIEVNHSWNEDVYLIIGARRMIWGGTRPVAPPYRYGSPNKIPVGTSMTDKWSIGGSYFGRVKVYGENIQLSSLAQNINNKVDVSQVGNEANKIPVIDSNGRLETSIMPDLAITDVIIIQDISQIMAQNVQKGDVVVVENIGNKTFMCKDENGQTQQDKFIEINMGYPVVKKVNGLSPSNVGELTINASQINATIENNTKTVEKHLTDIGQNLRTTHNLATSYNQRLNVLETRGTTSRVGEVVSLLTTSESDFVGEGCTFTYIGRAKNLVGRDYPQLLQVLGLPPNTGSFGIPVIQDQTITYDISRRITRKHFLCVKKS